MRVLIAAVLAITTSACSTAPVQPEMTPMEIQAMQSREFEAGKEIAFASVMSVFQDLGYTIESADVSTGFINASSAAKTNVSTLEVLFVGAQANSYTDKTRATAFIETTAQGGSRVRLNFVSSRQSSSGYGRTSANDIPILEPGIYQNAFEKIDTALFVRSGS